MPENYFMGLVGAVLGIVIVVAILRALFQRYAISLPLIFLIPLPGVNLSVLQEFFRRISKTQGMGIMNMFSSGAFERLTIFVTMRDRYFRRRNVCIRNSCIFAD